MISSKCWISLIDSIFVVIGELIFQQTVDIPMGTNCVPLLADLFLHSYEAESIQNLLKDKKKKHLAKFFNFTFRYIDNVLSLNSPHFCENLQSYILLNLRLKTLPNIEGQLHIWIFSLRLTWMDDLTPRPTTNVMISTFQLLSSHFFVVTFPLPLHMGSTYLSWYVMEEHALVMMISLGEGSY